MNKIWILAVLIFMSVKSFADQSAKIPVVDYGEKNIVLSVTAKTIDSPAPTVIIVHGCSGLNWHYIEWAKFLNTQGFNAVYYDGHGPRLAWYESNNICHHTTKVRPNHRVKDFFEIEKWIVKQPWHKGGIALLGFSNGGWHALDFVRNTWHLYREEKTNIKAVVGYYPYCSFDVITDQIMPLQVHIGKKDDWVPADFCSKLQEMWPDQRMNKDSYMELHLYDNAYHSFDREILKGGVWYQGGHFGDPKPRYLEYNHEVTVISKQRTIEFLRKHLY